MRIITEKEKDAFAKAFLRFMTRLNRKRGTTKTIRKTTDRAFDYGLTADVLFNKANYDRVAALHPDAGADTFVESLINREVCAIPLHEEEGWDESQRGFFFVADAFHEFFTYMCPKGGTWSTTNATRHLANAIRKFGLQAIMSESLISSLSEDKDITIFSFLVKLNSGITVENELTEEQASRKAEDEELKAAIEEFKDANEDIPEDAEALDYEDENDLPPNGLRYHNYLHCLRRKEQESMSDSDESEEPETEKPEENPDYEDGSGTENSEPWEVEDMIDPDETFVSVQVNPRDLKRHGITGAILDLNPADLAEFCSNDTNAASINEFIDHLTDGEVDFSNETAASKMTHQAINLRLVDEFIQCNNLQGNSVSEKDAIQFDLVTIGWDLRDDKTRILQKLRQLVAQSNPDDNDLKKAIRDLEEQYLG